jgi:Fe-S-cluster containining protein
MGRKKAGDSIKAKKSQCLKCTGQCCRYFALPIDTPKTREDYDDIRWFLCHKDITIFVEDGDWYINIKNKCRHLSEKDHRCRIYDKRPAICRKYRHRDCDFVEGEYEYQLHFTNDKQMQEYMNIKFDNNVKEKQKVRKKRRK